MIESGKHAQRIQCFARMVKFLIIHQAQSKGKKKVWPNKLDLRGSTIYKVVEGFYWNGEQEVLDRSEAATECGCETASS